LAANPPPDPAVWEGARDPSERARVAISAMYDWYAAGRDMLENVLRDAPLVPALETISRRKIWPLLEGLVDSLAEGWGSAVRNEVALRASLAAALDFYTWRTLVDAGLSSEQAARLVTRWVEASATA